MIACLRLFTALCLAALLAACASSPSSSLGELPRTPDASIEQLLDQAATSKTPEKAALLRLSAADLAAYAAAWVQPLDLPHRGGLLLDRQIAVKHADAADLRHHLQRCPQTFSVDPNHAVSFLLR